jgi:hypothetical protein
VTNLKGLSALHGLEELLGFVGAAALSVQCSDPRLLCDNSLLPSARTFWARNAISSSCVRVWRTMSKVKTSNVGVSSKVERRLCDIRPKANWPLFCLKAFHGNGHDAHN